MTDKSNPDPDFLTFPARAVETAQRRLPGLDAEAMRVVLLLHRVTGAVVYDLESSVHRPRGWSWSGFRLLFVLWVAGPLEATSAAALSGMSRAAVSNLVNTLERDGLVRREPSAQDARAVQLQLTDAGAAQLADAYREHNAREHEWSAILNGTERAQLIRLLDKLARGARADWVNHRK